jgi:hypothetical protein
MNVYDYKIPTKPTCSECGEKYLYVSDETGLVTESGETTYVFQTDQLAVKCPNKHVWLSDYVLNKEGFIEYLEYALKYVKEH